MAIRKKVYELIPGDIMSGTGEKVDAVFIASVKTPKGKIGLALIKDGKERFVLWGRYTVVGVKENN